MDKSPDAPSAASTFLGWVSKVEKEGLGIESLYNMSVKSGGFGALSGFCHGTVDTLFS